MHKSPLASYMQGPLPADAISIRVFCQHEFHSLIVLDAGAVLPTSSVSSRSSCQHQFNCLFVPEAGAKFPPVPSAADLMVSVDFIPFLCLMQVPYFPPVQSAADFPVSKCQDILCKATGLPDIHLDVREVKTWTMSAQVAERFQVMLHSLLAFSNLGASPLQANHGISLGEKQSVYAGSNALKVHG